MVKEQSYLDFIQSFLAPTGALGVKMLDLGLSVCVSVHFMYKGIIQGVIKGQFKG